LPVLKVPLDALKVARSRRLIGSLLYVATLLLSVLYALLICTTTLLLSIIHALLRLGLSIRGVYRIPVSIVVLLPISI
jgi:hypothetical protein